MGKGDQRSKRGKIHVGTWGVKRSRKKTKKAAASAAAKPAKKAEKKTAAKPAKKAKKES